MSPVVVVTGMAGAGRTTALKVLEDLGFEAVDNLPLPLLGRLLTEEAGEDHPLAIGIDSRARAFDPARLAAEVARLRVCRPGEVWLVFLDADDEVLLRRFTETRRAHPLAGSRPVLDAIVREREVMAPLRADADLVLDTSQFSVADLRRVLEGHFGDLGRRGLAVSVVSFGFRFGLPREADLVFDVRFLRNPHYDPALRPRTGRDPGVADFIAADPDYPAFEERLFGLLAWLLPRYAAEGKRYLTVAVGCTGGRHRSVFVAERLSEHLRALGFTPTVFHRELAREAAATGATA